MNWLRSWIPAPLKTDMDTCTGCGQSTMLWTQYQPHMFARNTAQWVFYCESCIDNLELEDRFDEIVEFENQRIRLRKQYRKENNS